MTRDVLMLPIRLAFVSACLAGLVASQPVPAAAQTKMSGLTHVSAHPDRGVFYGADGTSPFVSEDNGGTWRPLDLKIAPRALPCGMKIRALTFFDRRTGWAVGDCRTTFMTSDGGATWRTINTGAKESPQNKVYFSCGLSV